MQKKAFFICVVLLLVTISLTWAGDLSDPELTTFVGGTPAYASEINANFDAVQFEINDNDARIDTIEVIGADITAVSAGSGLTGGGTSGSVTISIGTGTVTATHLATDSVGAAEIAANAVGTSEIANGSVTAADIGDEAGLAYYNANAFGSFSDITFDPNWTIVYSISVTHPASGYVLCIGSMTVDWDNPAYNDYIRVGWSNSSSAAVDPASYLMLNLPSSIALDGLVYLPFTAVHTFPVTGSGTTTFYLKVQAASGDGTDLDYYSGSGAAIFFPTIY